MKSSAPLFLYRGFARYAGPLLARWLLRRRAARGKEMPERMGERMGAAGAQRPKGEVLWLHAASVGESVSLLPLIEALLEARPGSNIVLTTVTRTSAEMMANRLPEGAIHQFAPVDTPQAVGAFLDHWRPTLYAVVESEIWPVALMEAKARGVATALLSARISEKTARGWSYAPRSIEALLDAFDAILAQNQKFADRLQDLGAAPARMQIVGSLKEAAAPLPADATELDYWRLQLAGRPVWFAANSHPGEEELIFAAHKQITAVHSDALLVLAPRHPDRIAEVLELASAARLAIVPRSAERPPTFEDHGLAIDRMGEMGLWYRLAKVAFIGGSIAPVGGHNPLEPARLGVAMAFGPRTPNCELECERLIAAGAARRTGETAEEIAEAILELIGQDGRPSQLAQQRGAAAQTLSEAGGATLERHLSAIMNLIGPAPGEKTRGEGDSDARA